MDDNVLEKENKKNSVTEVKSDLPLAWFSVFLSHERHHEKTGFLQIYAKAKAQISCVVSLSSM